MDLIELVVLGLNARDTEQGRERAQQTDAPPGPRPAWLA